jgi:triacylglycerol lipase
MALPGALEHFVGGERLAFLREVTLMARNLAAVVPDARPGDDVVVLVHGFFASAGVFRPLRARLERGAGARVATFTHAPCVGVRRIARRLAELVDDIPRGARITIVGHSLGGIVARWYVQEMGGDARVAQTISLATPFHGVHVPQVFVGADLHAQSQLLARLRALAHLCTVPHTSIVAAADTVVVGIETACLGTGDVIVVPDRGHHALLFDDGVAGAVIDRVRRASSPAPR